MKFPFLASLIIMVVILSYELHKHRNMEKKQEDKFWERESLANSTRRKSLDLLEYIHLPLETFPLTLLTEQEEIKDCIEIITTLSTQKIVNFTGYSNTDLKLLYGAPNINLLTEYDQNYTLLARTLQKWALLLYQNGYEQEALTLLEFAVSTKTDVSGTYKLLCQIYIKRTEMEKIKTLLETAKELRSAMKDTIVRTVQESCP